MLASSLILYYVILYVIIYYVVIFAVIFIIVIFVVVWCVRDGLSCLSWLTYCAGLIISSLNEA
jgi:hypothetical protein